MGSSLPAKVSLSPSWMPNLTEPAAEAAIASKNAQTRTLHTRNPIVFGFMTFLLEVDLRFYKIRSFSAAVLASFRRLTPSFCRIWLTWLLTVVS